MILTLKAEQHSAMEAIYKRQDVFVWLPTGYGKSLCYEVLPFIMDYNHGGVETQRRSLVLVVSPLVALMLDQRWISCAHYLIISILITRMCTTVCTRPSPPPILEGLDTRLALWLPSIPPLNFSHSLQYP